MWVTTTETHKVLTCDLGRLSAGDCITATVGDSAQAMPCIRLMEDSQMREYLAGRKFESHGGRASGPVYTVAVPYDGHWHAAADFVGLGLTQDASAEVRFSAVTRKGPAADADRSASASGAS